MKQWKDFLLTDIFKPIRGNQKNMAALKSGNIPLVSARKFDNGYKDFVLCNSKDVFDGDCITINNDGNGGAGLAYYQPSKMAVDTHVTVLKPKENISKAAMLFLVECLNKQADLFSHARSLSNDRIEVYRFMLPVTSDGTPDYDYMETYITILQATQYQKGTTYFKNKKDSLKYKKIKPLAEINWKAIPLNEIFKIYSGKRLEKYNMVAGTRPFIGSTDSNNGITNFVSNENESIDKNVLGVNYNGSVVENFYHPYECIFSDDVKRLHLINHEDNPFVLLFFKTIILQQKKKYMYAYKFNEGRMKRQYIVVPVKDDDTPDYDYMEQYIKNLIIAKCEAYLNFKHIKR